MTTVQELIDKLNQIENKDLPVVIDDGEYIFFINRAQTIHVPDSILLPVDESTNNHYREVVELLP